MPSIENGGVEKNLFLICNFLAKKTKKISLITISKNCEKKFVKSVKLITLSQKIWTKSGRKLKYFLSLILLIKELIKDKNSLVVSFQANLYCILICKLFKVKIIVRSNTAPIGWSQNFFKKKIFKYVLNFADKIIVNSIEFRKDFEREFKIKPICIYNPLNQKEILQKSLIKKKKIFKNKSLKIINVGRLTDQKDQLTLLKALNLLKNKLNFSAIIMGNGVLKKQLNHYLNCEGLNKFVKIINYKKNPYPYIKQSNLFILSSLYEGLPNVLLEALTLNKFIISSNCKTGPKEILLNGKGGDLFKVGDYKTLANLIINYNSNKFRCLKKLKLSKKYLNRFNYKKNLDKYYNLIRTLN